MKTSYNFIGINLIFGSFISSMLLFIFGIYYFHVHNKIDVLTLIFIIIAFWLSNIYFWLHPIVYVEESGLRIRRFFILQRLVRWKEIKLYKRFRKHNSYRYLGCDPRYAKIVIKNANLIERYFFILNMFKDYDKMIQEIERNISIEDVITDLKYWGDIFPEKHRSWFSYLFQRLCSEYWWNPHPDRLHYVYWRCENVEYDDNEGF